MTRYERMFSAGRSDGIVIPFLTLGDPDAESTLAAARALIQAGADALELGIPFSDPVADGAVIQRASARAIAAGATPERCFELIAGIRRESASLPVGLLVYANTVVSQGLEAFYRAVGDAGADSVLIADVPVIEAAPFVSAARRAAIDPVFVVPPSARASLVARVAACGGGFTYLQGRPGVTGAVRPMHAPDPALIAALAAEGAPPPLVGFGVSDATHLSAALRAGARGVIAGSAIVETLERSNGERGLAHDLVRALERIRPRAAHLQPS